MIRFLFVFVIVLFLFGCSSNEIRYGKNNIINDYLLACVGDIMVVDSSYNKFIYNGITNDGLLKIKIKYSEYYNWDENLYRNDNTINFNISITKIVKYGDFKIEVIDINDNEVKFKVLK